MEYNTDREGLSIPEYGRNVQKMIDIAISETDKEKRQLMVNGILRVMSQTAKEFGDPSESAAKFETHLAVMSKFQLGELQQDDVILFNANKTDLGEISYPKGDIKFGHYGRSVERLIKQAIATPEGDEKNALILVIGNLMKKFYVTFNRNNIDNESIALQLKTMSEGKLVIEDPESLSSVSHYVKRGKKKKGNYMKKKKKLR